MEKELNHPKFRKVDAIVVKIFRYISYPAAILLVIIALIATINVITSKLFSWIVPSNIDWITYLIIPVVFLSLAHVQLDRGLVTVDFISSHYPKKLKDTIDIISDVLLIFINAFIGYRGFVLMFDKIATKEMSSTDAGSFYLWPFCLILGFGMFCFAFTSFWCILRTVFNVHPAEEKKKAEEEALEAEEAQKAAEAQKAGGKKEDSTV